MNFINDNHLNINDKKHEMILNLGLENKSSSVFADQTPTPTRLIKNCEEVGLFDDLKHVNPFDETFRRAVESQQTDIIISSSDNNNETFTNNKDINDEESLHTPQVFPSIETPTTVICQQIQSFHQHHQQEQSTITTTKTTEDEFQITKEQSVILLTENLNETINLQKDEEKTYEKSINLKKRKLIKTTKQKQKRQNNSKIITTTTSPTSSNSIILPNTISIIQPQIITLELPKAAVLPSKPILLPKTVEINTNDILNTTSSRLQSIISVKEKLKDVINNHSSPTSQLIKNNNKNSTINNIKYYSKKKRNNKDFNINSTINNDDEDSLERRRAAAMRYRRKIKKEQADLKQKNTELIAENAKLKTTIRQLTQLLANHQNCDIGQQQNSSSGLENMLNIANELHESSSSHNTIKSYVQIPTVKLLMNVPRIIIQQDQQQLQQHQQPAIITLNGGGGIVRN